MPVQAVRSIEYERATGPATLVFADSEAARGRLTALVTGVGGRVAALQTLRAAPRILDAWSGTAVAIFDLAEDGGVDDDRLLTLVQQGAESARFDSIVVADAALIDAVAARISDPRVVLLIEPDDIELTAAMSRLLASRIALVAEPVSGDEARRLAVLSEEAARIARALAVLSGEAGFAAGAVVEDPGAALAMTRALLRLRRLRDQFFERTLFADPAWDMLLDLFAARLERRAVAVSSLCIAAAVPPTTALRWITALTAQGLIARQPDPDDGRRVFIGLTEPAVTAMAGYMGAALRHARPAGP